MQTFIFFEIQLAARGTVDPLHRDPVPGIFQKGAHYNQYPGHEPYEHDETDQGEKDHSLLLSKKGREQLEVCSVHPHGSSPHAWGTAPALKFISFEGAQSTPLPYR